MAAFLANAAAATVPNPLPRRGRHPAWRPVPVYEIGEPAGQQFYSMAFVEGKSLAHAVAVSPLPPRRAAELIQPVATAIAQGVAFSLALRTGSRRQRRLK